MKGASGRRSSSRATRSIAVLLVDEDEMVRDWVRLCLRGTGFRVVAEASSAGQALESARRRKVDLLMTAYRLPDRSGLDLIRELRRSGVAVPALLLTTESPRGLDQAVRDVGAEGTVLRTGSTEELLRALQGLADEERRPERRSPRRVSGRAGLSPRERQVLTLVAAGRTNREISEILGVSDETVKTLLGRTFVKLGARRRAEAVSAAHAGGLL